MKMNPQVNIVIPLFNEEKVFAELIMRLQSVINESALSIEVILVDDGSKDATPSLMSNLSLYDKRFTSVFLSKNFGHQLALSSGLSIVNASEAIFILDGDLQDPPELLDDFYAQFKKGFDVVYAVRKKRKENIFKKGAYSLFYRILKNIAHIDIPVDSGDFALISRRVVDNLNAMPEESRFLRGMRTWIGYQQIGVDYERDSRKFGETKYSLKALIKLALNGIFNFSEFPIKFISMLGFGTMLVSVVYFIITIILKYSLGNVPQGFTSLVFLIILFGGAQLLAIGIIGEYVLRIFFQSKQRPLFIVSEIIRESKMQLSKKKQAMNG